MYMPDISWKISHTPHTWVKFARKFFDVKLSTVYLFIAKYPCIVYLHIKCRPKVLKFEIKSRHNFLAHLANNMPYYVIFICNVLVYNVHPYPVSSYSLTPHYALGLAHMNKTCKQSCDSRKFFRLKGQILFFLSFTASKFSQILLGYQKRIKVEINWKPLSKTWAADLLASLFDFDEVDSCNGTVISDVRTVFTSHSGLDSEPTYYFSIPALWLISKSSSCWRSRQWASMTVTFDK